LETVPDLDAVASNGNAVQKPVPPQLSCGLGHLTRERIRQIEAKALRKLKHPSRSRVLRSFLDN